MPPTSPATIHLEVDGVGPVDVTTLRVGTGVPVLLLHGGAGPQSMQPLATALAAEGMEVVAPVHPGFGGTDRPEALTTVRGLAATYAALVDELDLRGVTVVGNSVGGWIAAELALLASPRVTRLVLIDAAGIVVEGEPATDVAGMPLPEIMALSFHDPAPFLVDPATLPPGAAAVTAANQAALATYMGRSPAADGPLGPRLGGIAVPTLVVWGESDRIVTPAYGRAYAASIPGARFELLPGTGHMPQLETPAPVLAAITGFVGER